MESGSGGEGKTKILGLQTVTQTLIKIVKKRILCHIISKAYQYVNMLLGMMCIQDRPAVSDKISNDLLGCHFYEPMWHCVAKGQVVPDLFLPR
eukprot:7714412-Ditylum_brightwellii.AAC.1